MPHRSSDVSPESDVKPYESLDERQMAISGERFPELFLIVCDGCYWCSTCFNMRGLIDACPKLSQGGINNTLNHRRKFRY